MYFQYTSAQSKKTNRQYFTRFDEHDKNRNHTWSDKNYEEVAVIPLLNSEVVKYIINAYKYTRMILTSTRKKQQPLCYLTPLDSDPAVPLQ